MIFLSIYMFLGALNWFLGSRNGFKVNVTWWRSNQGQIEVILHNYAKISISQQLIGQFCGSFFFIYMFLGVLNWFLGWMNGFKVKVTCWRSNQGQIEVISHNYAKISISKQLMGQFWWSFYPFICFLWCWIDLWGEWID